MKTTTTKGISGIFVFIFAISSLSVISFTGSIGATEPTEYDIYNVQSDNAAECAEGFYDGIGEVFTARSDDGLDIKVFRYHAPGNEFNEGAQPVLLFPSLAMNINEYLQHTIVEIADYQMELPDVLADWAIGDENIEADPMLYYSLAYYLWKMGYDPWFGNYRGIGYGEMRSEDGSRKTAVDQFAIDVKAAVVKVNEVTGLHPVIGGHSTGGTSSMMYLHGTDFRWDGHIRSYDSLQEERNAINLGPQSVLGYIGLDPCIIPAIPLMNNYIVWKLLSTNAIIDIRAIIQGLLSIEFVDGILREGMRYLDSEILGEFLTSLLWSIGNMDLDNIDGPWLYFYLKYSIDKLYFHTMSQFFDGIRNGEFREHFNNGFFNRYKVVPPRKRRWDRYYYYTDNMDKFQVPSINFFATMENDNFDIVDADQVKRDMVYSKTIHENDECYDIDGAHLDAPIGLRAPVDVYPKIGNWLTKI